MITLLHHPITYLAAIVMFLLWTAASIIMFLIVGGGTSSPSVEVVTDSDIDIPSEPAIPKHFCNGECEHCQIAKARELCPCPCHTHRGSMYPGMRCLDCFGELCDEGTVQ